MQRMCLIAFLAHLQHQPEVAVNYIYTSCIVCVCVCGGGEGYGGPDSNFHLTLVVAVFVVLAIAICQLCYACHVQGQLRCA